MNDQDKQKLGDLAKQLPELQRIAKALWGEEYIDTGVPNGAVWQEENIEELAWQYHLQNMVISEDPIKYLGDNLD